MLQCCKVCRDDLVRNLVEEIQHVERPPDREYQPDWAAKIHAALVAPVYCHNYVLLAHLTAAQPRNRLEKYVVGGPFYEREISGRYLQEAFLRCRHPRRDWRETVLHATGRSPRRETLRGRCFSRRRWLAFGVRPLFSADIHD